MLTLWYSHDGARWYQAEKDNGSAQTYKLMAAARRNAIDMAQRFHSTVEIRCEGKVIETVTKSTEPAPVNSSLARAQWVDCPLLHGGDVPHVMRDSCWSCAPFWERFPVCPHCRRKLMRTGKTKCKGCNTFVMVTEEK